MGKATRKTKQRKASLKRLRSFWKTDGLTVFVQYHPRHFEK